VNSFHLLSKQHNPLYPVGQTTQDGNRRIVLFTQVETNSLVSRQPLPINTLDVMGPSLIFGGDNEAFYVLYNIVM
jgi:hypothetical protein